MLKALLEKIDAEVMTDEVKLSVSALFESTVNEAIKAKEIELEAQNTTEIAQFKENIVNQIDEYLNGVVESYVRDNEAQIVEGVQIDAAKRVLEHFSSLVDGFHLQLSEKVETDNAALKEAKAELNATVEKLVSMKSELSVATKKIALAEAASELDTDSQVEKLAKLAEGIEFDIDAIAEYKKKIAFFVESIKKDEATPNKIDESNGGDNKPLNENKNEAMTGYLSRL